MQDRRGAPGSRVVHRCIIDGVNLSRLEIALIAALAAAGMSACRSTGTDSRSADTPAGATQEAPTTSPDTATPSNGPERPPIVQPGAPGEPSRTISAEEAADLSAIRHTAADVAFMQGMIHHHAQALDMTALVPERTDSEELQQLALRIELSQTDEIGMMQTWLEAVGEDAPGAHDHHQAGMPLMPGMLTEEEMERLADARGREFDRLFLESMVRHHQGALVMVDELYATPSAGQESNVAAFTAEVVADQGAEIARMNAMINAMNQEPRR